MTITGSKPIWSTIRPKETKMKKLTILLMLVLVAALMLFSGCAKDDDDDNGGITGIPDVTPANYDWDIYFIDNSNFKSADYLVFADWLGNSSAITDEDEFTLEIDGFPYDLTGGYYEGEWSFSGLAENILPGTDYSMALKKNGYAVVTKTLKMPYQANVTFPNTFDPTKKATMNWQLSRDNKYQAVTLSAFKDGYDDDEYDKNISASDRKFTFDANSVKSFGSGTGYGMMLSEMNFESSGRVAFSSFSFTMHDYGQGTPAKYDASDLRKIAKKLRKNMQ